MIKNFKIKDFKKIKDLNDKIDCNNLRYKYKSGKQTNFKKKSGKDY